MHALPPLTLPLPLLQACIVSFNQISIPVRYALGIARQTVYAGGAERPSRSHPADSLGRDFLACSAAARPARRGGARPPDASPSTPDGTPCQTVRKRLPGTRARQRSPSAVPAAATCARSIGKRATAGCSIASSQGSRPGPGSSPVPAMIGLHRGHCRGDGVAPAPSIG